MLAYENRSGLDMYNDSIYLCILSSTGEIIEKVFGYKNVIGKICEGGTDPATHHHPVLMGASRTQDCFFNRFSYHQTQVRKKNKMKVQVAIARKILVCAWHILGENVPYQDFDNRIGTSA